jgi:hypothetical protein
MPLFGGPLTCPPGVHRQHAQLATKETTLSILTACFSTILQIRETLGTFKWAISKF